jgi:hypothetical protein
MTTVELPAWIEEITVSGSIPAMARSAAPTYQPTP